MRRSRSGHGRTGRGPRCRPGRRQEPCRWWFSLAVEIQGRAARIPQLHEPAEHTVAFPRVLLPCKQTLRGDLRDERLVFHRSRGRHPGARGRDENRKQDAQKGGAVHHLHLSRLTDCRRIRDEICSININQIPPHILGIYPETALHFRKPSGSSERGHEFGRMRNRSSNQSPAWIFQCPTRMQWRALSIHGLGPEECGTVHPGVAVSRSICFMPFGMRVISVPDSSWTCTFSQPCCLRICMSPIASSSASRSGFQ